VLVLRVDDGTGDLFAKVMVLVFSAATASLSSLVLVFILSSLVFLVIVTIDLVVL
jgi:hypothetical protein